MSKVRELNDNSFRVKLHLMYVEKYRNKDTWQNLDILAVSEFKEHIAPLIEDFKDDELAKRFDYLIYTIDLAYLQNKNTTKPIETVISTAEILAAEKAIIPQVKERLHIIEKVQTPEFWENIDIFGLEEVREALRELLKYIDRTKQKIYYTDFQDKVTKVKEGQPIYNANNLKNYRKKVEHYLKEHQNELAIYKLRNNKKLTETDVRQLEKILWEDLGSRTDYEREYGKTPITKMVRKIVGMDRKAAHEAFSEFLSKERLNLNQIRFVRLIVDYIVKNGMLEDNSILMEEPFRGLGSITTLFKDNIDDVKRIMKIVDEINKNSETIA